METKDSWEAQIGQLDKLNNLPKKMNQKITSFVIASNNKQNTDTNTDTWLNWQLLWGLMWRQGSHLTFIWFLRSNVSVHLKLSCVEYNHVQPHM